MGRTSVYGSILAVALLSVTATYSLAQTTASTADRTEVTAEDDGFDLGWLGLLGLIGLAGLKRRDTPVVTTTNRV